MTPGSDHIVSHRLYPAATSRLQLTAMETQHLRDCPFCKGIFQFFNSSRISEKILQPTIFATVKKTRK